MSEYVEVLAETTPKARKPYPCKASQYLQEHDTPGMLTFQERRAIVKAKQNNWMIQKGEVHYCQRNVYDGQLYNWRAIAAIHAICNRLELYPEC